MPALVLWIFVILVFSIISSSRKRNAKKPQVKTEQAVHTETEPVNEQEESFQSFESFDHEEFCQASGAEENDAWDSRAEFHEGEEDPSHDHGGLSMSFSEEVEEVSDSQITKDMLRGIIWSEILNRKKR